MKNNLITNLADAKNEQDAVTYKQLLNEIERATAAENSLRELISTITNK
jgi:hypothetical protein